MKIKKITSIILAALVISSQTPIQVGAMRSANAPFSAEASSEDKVKVAKSYALGLVNGIRYLSYGEKISIPRFISPEDARKYFESVISQFTPVPHFHSLDDAESYVTSLAHRILEILNKNEQNISSMDTKQRDTLNDEIYAIINEFHHIIKTIDDEIELPDYLSNMTKRDARSMSILRSTVAFPAEKNDLDETKKITITPDLKKSLITYHLTMLFMNESFGRYLDVQVKNDSICNYAGRPSNHPANVYDSVMIQYEGIVNRMLEGVLKATSTKWNRLDSILRGHK